MSFAGLRFGTALLAAGAGATLGAGAFVFGAGAERWVGFAVGACVLSVTLAATATAGRGSFQRGIDALLGPTAAWTLVAARVLELHSDRLTKWLSVSAGAAIGGLGLIALIAHEIAVESDLRWALRRLSEHSTFHGLQADGVGQPVHAEEWRP